MVHNTNNLSFEANDEISEFQMVHAIITQHIEGDGSKDDFEDGSKNISLMLNDVVSSICLKFHTIPSNTSKRRVIPTFIQQTRQKKFETIRQEEEEIKEAECSSNQEQSPFQATYQFNQNSNVQQKVHLFEQRASQRSLLDSFANSSPSSTRRLNSPNHDPQQDDDVTMMSEQPIQLTGRNRKRIPNERFRKMRNKVQKLMQHHYDQHPDDQSRLEQDEESFLKSLRIQQQSDLLPDSCGFLRLPDHVLLSIFSSVDTRTLSALKATCSDFNYVINFYDVRGTDSRWTKDKRYLDDPCKQCRRHFIPGDQTLCRYHPKRYHSDQPFGRNFWMCCWKDDKEASGCQVGLHDNHWTTTDGGAPS